MIIPKEVPFKEKLHSYYLIFENFVASMQEEIGCGCIYCQSTRQAHMVYFTADELVCCVVEDRGQPQRIYHQLGDVLEAFKVRPFIVSVHSLDKRAVYFWGQLPPYEKLEDPINNTSGITLETMVEQYKTDRFSGFFDITSENGQGGLLFFQDGKIIGGSYAWGKGGFSAGEEDYRRLVALFGSERCILDIGTFSPVQTPHVINSNRSSKNIT